MTRPYNQSDLSEILDQDISEKEIEECISSCQKKEAVSKDVIPNEFLHSHGVIMRGAFFDLFNQCLSQCVYPLTTSVA